MTSLQRQRCTRVLVATTEGVVKGEERKRSLKGGEAGPAELHAGPERVGTLPTCTPPWRIRLKARVDLGDQTAEFIPFKVIRTAVLACFYPF